MPQEFNEIPKRAISKQLQIELVCAKYIILCMGVFMCIYKHTNVIK